MTDLEDTLATAEIITLKAEYTPEKWLEDRLQYLTAHPENMYGPPLGIRTSAGQLFFSISLLTLA
jgi:hypothetical protein